MAATKTSRRSSAASARPIASNARGTAGGKARTTVVKGAKVFTFAQKQPDGSLASNSLVVGAKGSTPPM